jgi:RHS repeat-associated protein
VAGPFAAGILELDVQLNREIPSPATFPAKLKIVCNLGPANLLTGLGIDQVFTRTDGTGTRELFSDALGSTVALANSAGAVQTSYTYEPFGGTTQTGTASSNSFKFTGREDDGTGLMYYRARYYSPRLQRFISEDPIGFLGGDSNLYVYVWDQPTSFRDPLGWWGVGGVLGGSASYGLGAAGGAINSSSGYGIFGDGLSGLNAGGFESTGAFLGGPGYGPSYPRDNSLNTTLGAFAGVGGGFFATNAKCAKDLERTNYTASYDAGVGPLKFSVSFSYGGGIGQLSVTVGSGIGLGRTNLATNTTSGLPIGIPK